jgi:hypothetical protein
VALKLPILALICASSILPASESERADSFGAAAAAADVE